MLLSTTTDYLGLSRLSPLNRLAITAIGNGDITGSNQAVAPGNTYQPQIGGSGLPIRVRAGGDPADTGQQINVYGYTRTSGGVLVFSKVVLTTAGAAASAPSSLNFRYVSFAQVTNLTGNVGTIIIETTGGTALLQIDPTRYCSEAAAFGLPAASVALIQRLQVRVTGGNPLTNVQLWAANDNNSLGAPIAWFDDVTDTTPLDMTFDPPLFVPAASSSGTTVGNVAVVASSGAATRVNAVLSATITQAVTSTLF